MLSFDANGNHKPTYKHPKPSQKSGPYQLNRGNSMTSPSSTRNRSMDDLFGAGASGDSSSAAGSGSSDGITQTQRMVKSEAASPMLEASSFAQLNGQLPPLDLSGIKYPSYIPNSADFFGSLSDYEQPMFSAGLSAVSVDWSNYEGLELAGKTDDFAPSNYSQAQSYGGFDFTGSEHIPTMTTTTSTSGEVSEVEDFLTNPLDDFEPFHSGPVAGYGYGHVNLLGNPDPTNLDLDDFDFMKKDANKFLTNQASMAGDDPTLLTTSAPVFGGLTSLDDDPAFWMNDYGMPSVTDSPTESNMPSSFWDGQ
jgi:hypothetical protein